MARNERKSPGLVAAIALRVYTAENNSIALSGSVTMSTTAGTQLL